MQRNLMLLTLQILITNISLIGIQNFNNLANRYLIILIDKYTSTDIIIDTHLQEFIFILLNCWVYVKFLLG